MVQGNKKFGGTERKKGWMAGKLKARGMWLNLRPEM